MKKKAYILLFMMFLVFPCFGLRILFFTSIFPHFTKTFDIDDIIFFIDRGHDVKIFSHRPKQNQNLYYCYQPEHLMYGLEKLVHYEEDFETESFLKNNEFDIFFAGNGISGYKALEIKKKFNKNFTKIMVNFRGPDVGIKLRDDPEFYNLLLKNIDCALPMTKYMKKKLQNVAADAPCLMEILPNGVKFEKFTQKFYSNETDNIQVITVARLDVMKGINYAILAFKKIVSVFPNVNYIIVGDGPENQSLSQLVKDCGLEKKIKFLGQKSRDEVRELLRVSDIFLHPSITTPSGSEEGIPFSIMEAMAVGIPVISSYHAGIPEVVIHNKTGLLAKEKDVDKIAEYLEDLIDDATKRKNLGLQSRFRIKHKFNREYWDNRLNEIILNLSKKESTKRLTFNLEVHNLN